MQNSVYLCNWFWWRNRASILVMLGSVLIAQAAFWIWGGEDSLPESLLAISIAASCLSAFTVFTFGSDLDLTSGKSAFPQWLFNMPVASVRLGLIPVLAMVVALAWGWMPAAGAMKYSMSQASDAAGPSYFELLVLPWMGLCAFATWMQAIAWWPFRRAWLRLGCLGAIVLGIVLLQSVGVLFELGAWYPACATIIPAISGFVAAVFSATRARHLTWRSEAESVGVADLRSDVGCEEQRLATFISNDFSSSISAIAWRDWTQLGRAPLILMLMLSVPTAICVAAVASAFQIVIFMFCVPAMLLLLVGPMLGKSRYWKDNYALSTYLGGLPVSDGQFVASRFVNTLKTAFALWGCALGVALVWLARDENRVALKSLVEQMSQIEGVVSGWTGVIACVLLTLYLAVIAPWPGLAIGLYGRKWLKTLTMIVLCFCGFWAFVYICLKADKLMPRLNNPQLRGPLLESILEQVRFWMTIVLGTKIVLAIVFVGVALRRQVLQARELAIGIPSLLAGCGLSVAIFSGLLVPFGVSAWDIALVVGLTFPCASLVASRVALELNRHR